jgi:hypothetical protein
MIFLIQNGIRDADRRPQFTGHERVFWLAYHPRASVALARRQEPQSGGTTMSRTERSGHSTTDHDFIRRWVEERSRDDWFTAFDENELAFLHRDMEHGKGDLDRFNKLVRRRGKDEAE